MYMYLLFSYFVDVLGSRFIVLAGLVAIFWFYRLRIPLLGTLICNHYYIIDNIYYPSNMYNIHVSMIILFIVNMLYQSIIV